VTSTVYFVIVVVVADLPGLNVQLCHDSAVQTNFDDGDGGVSSELCDSVHISTTNNADGKRKYDKRFYCVFCELPQSHIVRHWETKHKDQLRVIELSKKSAASRRSAITKLRTAGNHIHNTKVLSSGVGDLAVTYRPQSTTDPAAYVPCETCLAYLHKKELYRHKCPLRGRSKCRVAANAALLLPAPSNMTPAVHKMLNEMQHTSRPQFVTKH